MPLVIATRTTPPEYLAESADGSWVRTDCALNAAMWEDLPGLLAWLDGLPPDRLARLDEVGVMPVAIDLDLTGWRPEPPRIVERRGIPERRYLATELTFRG